MPAQRGNDEEKFVTQKTCYERAAKKVSLLVFIPIMILLIGMVTACYGFVYSTNGRVLEMLSDVQQRTASIEATLRTMNGNK